MRVEGPSPTRFNTASLRAAPAQPPGALVPGDGLVGTKWDPGDREGHRSRAAQNSAVSRVSNGRHFGTRSCAAGKGWP